VPDLAVVPVGVVPSELLARIAGFLETSCGNPCYTAGDAVDPESAYDAVRGQFDCRRLFPLLETIARDRGCMVLGVADVDLYSAVFTFVFGEAHLGGRTGIFSLHRLSPAVYGLPPDPELLEARARREALHETGHLLGLVHCREPECVMRFSGSAEEVDLKTDRFCPDCRDRIGVTAPG